MNEVSDRAFEVFMAAYWENGPTGLGMRKSLEVYESAKAQLAYSEISVVDEISALRDAGFSRFQTTQILEILQPYLRTTKPMPVKETFQQNRMMPFPGWQLRIDDKGIAHHEPATKPVMVSLEKCAHAIFESDRAMDSISFVNESNGAKDIRHTKAVLDAAGVKYVD